MDAVMQQQPQTAKTRARALARSVVRFGLELSPLRGQYFWRVPAVGPNVALTFDDGPDPDRTPEVLRILAHHGATATFFLLGERAEQYPELVRKMAEAGHCLGNHTWSHPHCPRFDADAVLEELRRTEAAISVAIGGTTHRLFRPPYGEVTLAQARSLLRGGWRVAQWSADSRDYRGANRMQIEACGETVVARDVLLMHDSYDTTVAALPGLLESLKRRGLHTVRLDDARG